MISLIIKTGQEKHVLPAHKRQLLNPPSWWNEGLAYELDNHCAQWAWNPAGQATLDSFDTLCHVLTARFPDLVEVTIQHTNHASITNLF